MCGSCIAVDEREESMDAALWRELQSAGPARRAAGRLLAPVSLHLPPSLATFPHVVAVPIPSNPARPQLSLPPPLQIDARWRRPRPGAAMHRLRWWILRGAAALCRRKPYAERRTRPGAALHRPRGVGGGCLAGGTLAVGEGLAGGGRRAEGLLVVGLAGGWPTAGRAQEERRRRDARGTRLVSAEQFSARGGK
jgi:hypothetical protein